MSEGAVRIPLLLDVDTGIDDSLALLYACASAEAEMVAVTCVAGNVDARQVAENTRAVLELAGRALRVRPRVLAQHQPAAESRRPRRDARRDRPPTADPVRAPSPRPARRGADGGAARHGASRGGSRPPGLKQPARWEGWCDSNRDRRGLMPTLTRSRIRHTPAHTASEGFVHAMRVAYISTVRGYARYPHHRRNSGHGRIPDPEGVCITGAGHRHRPRRAWRPGSRAPAGLRTVSRSPSSRACGPRAPR